jgi:hypothetical protein
MADTFKPTAEQVAALYDYAAKYGAQWKAKLANAWLNGSDAREPDGHLLRQMRNRGGPSWLKRVDLARERVRIECERRAHMKAEWSVKRATEILGEKRTAEILAGEARLQARIAADLAAKRKR